MADEQKRNLSESVRLWVQAVAIPIVATGISLWQFWLKEYVLPAQAPVNLTTEVTLTEAGDGQVPNRDLEPVELMITAHNPSTRDVYLLTNYWIAEGIKIGTPKEGEDWLQDNVDAINGGHVINGGKYYRMERPILVASANVFPVDSVLHPTESISASYVFYVPRGVYDLVEVDAILPTTSKAAKTGGPAAAIEFSVEANREGYDQSYYRIRPDGKPEEIPKDAEGNYLQSGLDDLGLQYTTSIRTLPLVSSRATPPPDQH
jgi:hypothetical protein